MIRVDGVLPNRQMAGIAIGREAQELADRQVGVASVTFDRSVRSEQRKAVLVILHLLRGDIPALNRVTLRAVRAHLAAVNIGVAIRAIFADVREHRFDVALDAVHFFVQAAQRVFRFVVIEFRRGADGAPARGSMATFAGDTEWAMRIAGGLFLSSGRRLRRCRGV